MSHTSVKKSFSVVVLASVMALALPGCGLSRTAKGGLIGAGGGAVLGGAIGKVAGNTAVGAILGAAVGGAAGALIGKHMDKQAEKMKQDIDGAKVERVGEGILVTFESGILFAVGKSDLTTQAKSNLDNLAQFLNKEADTEVLIAGHTDSTGSDDINQPLSEDRAAAVASYLAGQGINQVRVRTIGHGAKQPVGDNETKEGRAENRRVEVAVFAGKNMVKRAEGGQL